MIDGAVARARRADRRPARDAGAVVVVGDGTAPARGLPLRGALDAPRRASDAVVAPHDPSVILFTSGTTGPLEGRRPLPQRELQRSPRHVRADGVRRGRGALQHVPPLPRQRALHDRAAGDVCSTARACVLHDRFSASGFWDICRAEGVTAFNFMGALVLMLFKQPERDDDADNPVRVRLRGTGAGRGARALRAALRRRARSRSTDRPSSAPASRTAAAQRRIGSCGREAPHYFVEIHDEDDNPRAAGRRGRDRGAPARAAHHGRGVLRRARGEPGGVPEPLVPHGRPRPQDEDGWFYVRRPPQGRDPPAWREHLVVGGRAGRERPRGGGGVGGRRRPVRAHRGGGDGRRRAARRGTSSRPRSCSTSARTGSRTSPCRATSASSTELPKNHAQRIQKPVLREQGVEDAWDREDVGYVVRR